MMLPSAKAAVLFISLNFSTGEYEHTYIELPETFIEQSVNASAESGPVDNHVLLARPRPVATKDPPAVYDNVERPEPHEIGSCMGH